MTTLILYKSKHKATLYYAKCLAKKTGAQLFNIDEFNLSELDYYSTIIFGSSLSFSKLDIAPYILKYFDKLKKKRLILYSVTSHKHENSYYSKIYSDSLPQEIRNELHYFPLYGVLAYDKLNYYEKVLFYLTPRRDTLGVFEVNEEQVFGIYALLKKGEW